MNSPLVPAVLTLDPNMVADMALGNAELPTIARRYGLGDLELFDLLSQPAFARMLDDKRAELQRDGVTFALKCRLLAEELLPRLAEKARATNDPEVLLKIQTYFTRAGGLEPSKGEGLNVNLSGDAKAVINIIRPGAQVPEEKPKTLVIEHSIDPAVAAKNAGLQ